MSKKKKQTESQVAQEQVVEQQVQEQPQEQVAREKIRLVLDKLASVYVKEVSKLVHGDFLPIGYRYQIPQEIEKCIETIKSINTVKYAELTSTLCTVIILETREKSSMLKEYVKTTVLLLTPDQLFKLCTEYSL